MADDPMGSQGSRSSGASDEARAVQAAPGARTPQGTMTIVLIYALTTVVLWFYMYYVVLKSEGLLGGF